MLCRDTLNFNLVLQKMNQTFDIKLEKPSKDFTPAWIDDIEIRTETHDFELKKQEYNLRFTPVSVWIRAAQEAYYRSNIEKFEFDANKIKSDQMIMIYEDWIDLIFDKMELDLSRELISLYEDEEAVREKMISSSVESMDRYLEFRETKYNYEIEYELQNLIMDLFDPVAIQRKVSESLPGRLLIRQVMEDQGVKWDFEPEK